MELVSVVRCNSCRNCIIPTSGECDTKSSYRTSYYCTILHTSVNPMFFCAHCAEKKD